MSDLRNTEERLIDALADAIIGGELTVARALELARIAIDHAHAEKPALRRQRNAQCGACDRPCYPRGNMQPDLCEDCLYERFDAADATKTADLDQMRDSERQETINLLRVVLNLVRRVADDREEQRLEPDPCIQESRELLRAGILRRGGAA